MLRCFFITLIFMHCAFPEKVFAQSKTDTTFLDKVQKFIEIRRSFEIESQAKNPALLSYKKAEKSEASITIDLAVSYLGFRFSSWQIKPFLQIDFSGDNDKKKNELLTTGISTSYYPVNNASEKLKLLPDLFYTRDFFNKLNVYRAAVTIAPEFRNFFIPIVDYTKGKFSEESIDGKWLFGFNPNLTFKLKETDYDDASENTTDCFVAFNVDVALRKWYFQFVVSGLGERVFGDTNEFRYDYGATVTLYFDEKERSSLNARFQQKGSDLKQAAKSFTLGLGLKL